MIFKTSLIEKYVNFVNTTKKTKQILVDGYNYTYIYKDYTYKYTICYTIINIYKSITVSLCKKYLELAILILV